MKKVLLTLLVVCLAFSAFANGSGESAKDVNAVEAVAKEAAKMTWDELLAKAKEEVGNEELVIYAVTSRPNEKTFTEKTGINIKVSQPTDSEIFELLENSVGSGIFGADVIVTTDSFNLTTNAIENGWTVNYVPESVKATIDDSDEDPLVCLYYNRAFIYNNGNGTLKNYLTNIWQLTEPEYKGCEVKSPLLEKATMNWLISMTSPVWQEKIGKAYKDYYGKEWAPNGIYTNVAYEWIHKFIQNCTFVSKDGTIASDIAAGAKGSIGFFTFSKFRSVDYSSLSVVANEGINGFAGQLYPIYIQVMSNAKHPYAACLYVNYLMNEEGFMNVFGKDMGAYSSNTTIAISDNAKSVGDQNIDFWLNCLVKEDAEYVAKNYAQAYTKIAQWCASK